MTHLGLVSAAAAAEKGFRVIAFDPDSKLITKIVAGDYPIYEPGLAELIDEVGDRLRFTSDGADIGQTSVMYIAADVPTDEQGDSDIDSIDELIQLVASQIDDGSVMVVMSQVPPGYTRQRDWPDARLFYQVETLVIGEALQRAGSPERFMVGCADPSSPLTPAYAEFLNSFGCPVIAMRYESAELAKIANNCFLASTLTMTNTLAEICEQIGADWSEIAPALRLDRRIGPHAYLSPGLGIGGGNIERDLRTIARLAAGNGTEAGVIESVFLNSAHRKKWILQTLHNKWGTEKADLTIAVLGLSYKPGSSSTKNSAAIDLLESLSHARIRAFDPVIDTIGARFPNVGIAASASACCTGADVIVVMTAWTDFAALTPDVLSKAAPGAIVIDPWAVLDGEGCAAAGLDYQKLGSIALSVL